MVAKWNYLEVYRGASDEWFIDVTVTLLVSPSPSATFVDVLNTLGSDGWELVDVVYVGGQIPPWCGFLRRPQGQGPVNGYSSPMITEWLHMSVARDDAGEWRVDLPGDVATGLKVLPPPAHGVAVNDVLNHYGDDGWELVNVEYLGGSKWCAFMKRRRDG